MKTNQKKIPLSLYIHIPWCRRKCPYCDFVSFESAKIPEEKYVNQLIHNLDYFLPFVSDRELISIFIGGGTPSLFSAKSYERLFNEIQQRISFSENMEISMEANPGTFDETKIKEFYSAEVNRLSIGIQSFQDEKLKLLGRIHDSETAKKAIEFAKSAGFKNINLDLMFGLPNQTLNDALFDLKTAFEFQTQHLSWYQLTIEPGTPFARQKLHLPTDDELCEMQNQGILLLGENGFHRYEISGYAEKTCKHNLNYWEFGDYMGIGVASHSKLSSNGEVIRFHFGNDLKAYFNAEKPEKSVISKKNLPLEFMMNALRLTEGFPVDLFEQRTDLPLGTIKESLGLAVKNGYITIVKNRIEPTELGKQFLNRCLVECFMENVKF